jgi:hypothetical protein
LKKAKVKNGLVQHVWPWLKTLPDGREVVKELPEAYRTGVHPYIVDVPDDVKPGWKWNGERYAPIVKEPLVKPRNWVMEVVAERLGTTFTEILAEAKARKRAAKENR